jgi:hypothetical protein
MSQKYLVRWILTRRFTTTQTTISMYQTFQNIEAMRNRTKASVFTPYSKQQPQCSFHTTVAWAGNSMDNRCDMMLSRLLYLLIGKRQYEGEKPLSIFVQLSPYSRLIYTESPFVLTTHRCALQRHQKERSRGYSPTKHMRSLKTQWQKHASFQPETPERLRTRIKCRKNTQS